MILSDLAKKAEKLVIDNSPTILTALAVTGAVTTAYLTGKASFKAAGILRMDREVRRVSKQEARPAKEEFQLVWKEYVPAATTGVFTIVAIVGANHISHRRAAALAAAYSISERAFSEYKEKVIEVAGKAKEQRARDEVAQDQVTRTPLENVLVTGAGEILCFDAFTGRYFMSSMESLKKAQNDTNYTILNDGYASLGYFYNCVGIPGVAFSEDVGWTSDKKMELEITTCLSEDQRPCLSMGFRVEPVRGYYKFH